jgi:hypothetical protein
MQTTADITRQLISFIESLGIEVKRAAVPAQTFLPGMMIENGCIIMDDSQLLHPGDLLHEAAHIAVVPASERPGLHNDNIPGRPQRESEEMSAIAWSYAACKYLDISPLVVFHEHGYRGGGAAIAADFDEGRYFGVPILQWLGMTGDPKGPGETAYPNMIQWLRS